MHTIMIFSSGIAFFLLVFCAICKSHYVEKPRVTPSGQPWPMPKLFKVSANLLVLDASGFYFQNGGFQCDILQAAYKRYTDIMFGPGGENKSTRSNPDLTFLTVEVGTDCRDVYPNMSSDESYNLTISSSGAVLKSKEVWGALRGLETFSQVVYRTTSEKAVVNEMEVVDSPRFPHRGLMLDTSRNYLKMEYILTNLEAMAQNKFNVFHWHIVDDPSFPYQSIKFPNMSFKGAFNPETHIYTPTDVKDDIEFARLRGIRVMVEYDSPGHTQSWGKGIPNLLTKCYSGGKFNGNYGPIDPSVNSTFDFLKEFFTEIVNVFPDDYLFLGGDEVSFTCWKSNPDITKFMKKMGFGTDYAKLEEYYMKRLMDIITGLKKGFMIWQDVVDNGVKVKNNTIVNVWRPGPWQSEMANITKLGYRTMLTSPWYLETISYGSDWINYYKVDPQNFTGTPAQKDLVVGGEVCMWGEYVDDTNLLPRTWPRAASVGEKLWSPLSATGDYLKAQPRIGEHRCRMVSRGFPAEELIGPGFCADEY